MQAESSLRKDTSDGKLEVHVMFPLNVTGVFPLGSVKMSSWYDLARGRQELLKYITVSMFSELENNSNLC